MRILIVLFVGMILSGTAIATPPKQPVKYKIDKNIFYLQIEENKADKYQQKQCRLDIYYPTNKKDFATIIWFHGGGLKAGSKSIPQALKNKGMAVVAVEYRLYPKVRSSVCIQDAAAGVAWVFKNIKKYGGDTSKIFLSGHSAGGYLSLMVGLDSRWLKEYDVDASKIAGLIPFSGHTITHMTVREEKGIPQTQPIIDEYAPLYYVRKKTMPILLITGDRNLELLGRYEENAYFVRMMKVCGNNDITIYELQGYGHGMTKPAYPLAIRWIQDLLNKRKAMKEGEIGTANDRPAD